MGAVTAAAPSACAGATVQLNGSAGVSSSVTGYSFSASSSTYSAITGTNLTGTGNLGDDVGTGNLPIGFTFPYNGTSHTVFAMSSNGLILLGNTTSALTGFSSNALASTANSIALLWDDNNTTGGTMTYLTTGTAPNRVLTIQWTNMHVAGGGSSTTPTISAQIKLYETGVVELIYGTTSAALSSPSVSIGISGASGSYLSVTSATPIDGSTVSTSSENTSVNTTYLVSGTKFTFTPPTLTYNWTFNDNSNSLSSATIVNPVATINASDTYTLTATGSDGCSASGNVSVALGGGSLTATATASSASLCIGASTILSSSVEGGCSPFAYSWSDGTSVISTASSFVASPTSSKTYTLTVTDNNSETSTSSVAITVNSLPTVAVNSGTFCSSGSPLALTASGASTYAWSPATGLSGVTGSSVTSSPASTTTYTVTGTDENGCVASAQSIVTYVTAPTSISITQTPSSVCSGSVATLSTTGGSFPNSTVTIGTGTIQNSSSDSYSAFNGYRSSQWSQTIYTASELTSAGVLPGAISSLAYNISTLGSSTSNNITIKIGTTNQTTVGTTFMSTTGFTTVFGPTAYTHTASGWQTINFANNFVWDGSSNIVVDVWQDGPNSSANPLTYMTTLTSYRALYTFNTTTAGTSGTQTYNRMNIRFTNVPNQPTFEWSPTTNLFTNAAATIAYTGSNATTVYALNTSSTQYTATSTNGSCSTSTLINTSVNPLPTITLGTASAVCAGGTSSSLDYTATTGSPNQYTIDFDATANAGGFVDVTSYTEFSTSPITLSIPSGAAAGTYNATITVKNSTTGCISSATAFTVTINAPVSITAQPNNSVSLEGSDATFSLTATGTGLTYQWQVSTDGGSTWNNASGTSTNSAYTEYSITLAMAGNKYQCIISGTSPCGSGTSSVATLTISTTAITSQPTSATICSNGSYTFTIATSGSTPTYQWQLSTDGGSIWNDVTDATTSSLSVSGLTSANTGNRYRCILSGSINSDAAVLTVYDAVVIGTQPTSQSVCSNAASATFSVSATGSNLTYQWQVSTNGGSSWSNASGTSTASTYTVSAITNSLNLNQYRVIVSGSSPCSSVTSNPAFLNVVGFSLETSSASICLNSSITFTTTPTAGSPELSYSWICATTGSGATTANTSNPATITPTEVGSYTYTLTTTGGGCTLTSTQSVTVNSNPTITSATASPASTCNGANISLAATNSVSSTFNGGRTAPVGTSTYNDGTTGLVFSATSEFTLNSVKVYNNGSSGTLVIRLFNSAGTVLQTSSSFSIAAGTGTTAYTANLGWNIPVGTGYRLVATTVTSISLVRESSLGGFPYALGSVGNITGGWFGGASASYYHFYDWNITALTNNSSAYSWSWNVSPSISSATGTTTAINNTGSAINQTYTVTATNPTTGCISSLATSEVTINPLPAAPTANSSVQCGVGIPTASLVSNTGATTPNINWYTNAGATTLASMTYSGDLINYYSNNFGSSVVTPATLSGSASVTAGKAQLNANSTNLLGALTIPASGINADKYRISFDFITSTSGGADGMSYSFGDDISATSTTVQAEHGNGSKLSVAFDDYGSETGASGIRLIYGSTMTDPGTTVGTNNILAYSASTPWIAATASVVVNIDNQGRLTLSINGSDVFTNVQLPAAYLASNKATWSHCFKARSGGIANEHSIDNVVVQQSAGSLSIPTSVSSTVTYYITESIGTCSSSAVPLTVSVNTAPTVSAAASVAAICSGQSSTLSASSSNASYSYSWSNSAGSGSSVSVSPSATTTYTVTATDASGGVNDGCSSVATVSVTVNPLPTAVTITPSAPTICSGNVQSLVVSGGLIANAGTVVIGNSSTLTGATSQPTAFCNRFEHIWQQMVFTAAELNAAGLQAGNINGLKFNIGAQGSANSVTDFKIRLSSTANSTLSAFQTSNLNLVYSVATYNIAVGLNTINFDTPYYWDGTSNILVDMRQTGIDASNNATTYYTATTGNTVLSAITSTTYTSDGFAAINPSPTASPNRLNTTFIGNVPIQGSVVWSPTSDLFTNAAATTAYTGTSVATVYAKPTTTATYTATATSAAGCTSSNTVQVTVNQPSVAPTSISGTNSICIGSSTTLTAEGGTLGTGANYEWGTGSTVGSNAIVGETSASITVTPSATTTYWVRITNGTAPCTITTSGVSAAVTVTNPATPVVNVVDNCNGTSTLSTTATGTLAWSTSETTSPITVSTAGTYTVTQTVNGCTSAAGSGVAAPKTTPVTPSVSVTNDCGLSTLVFTPEANATILWSNDATTSSTTTANTETLTVVQTVNGCPSSAGSGSAVPLVIPSAPTATASQNFCVTDNATVSSLAYTSVVGNTYTWYDAATAGSNVATSTQLPTATTTYYLATTGSNGCTSTTRTAVAATESAVALSTVSITGTTVCAGGEILFTATPVNGGPSPTYQWYNGGVPISGATSETYSATGLAEGAVITVKMIPSGSCVTVCPN
jgi:hypothetical protein